MARLTPVSAAEARRAALAAQGFCDAVPPTGAGRRHVLRTIGRLQVVQLDSVNVVVRSHELPLRSRLGDHRRGTIEALAYEERRLFEYWGHEASLLPVDLQPLFRWRMARGDTWGGMAAVVRDRPEYVAAVLAEVRERGPIAASELRDPGERRGPWWGWGDGKRALEYLFWTGQLAASTRRNFERRYDVPERVIPTEVLAAPTPSEPDAIRSLLVIAARALGVATVADLADYFRMRMPDVRPRIPEIVEAGELVPVSVEGWREPGYAVPGLRIPRRAGRRALLSPFDNLIWTRPRTERLFGFRYRLEIFTPAPKRVHGYYVLPLLDGERFVARADLKADRKAGVLRALHAWVEPGIDPRAAAASLAGELRSLAAWLGLEGGVDATGAGDLGRDLRRALRPPRARRA